MTFDIREHCLFFDVDGTLIDIAGRPDEVRVPDDVKQSLRAASAANDGAVALVSGRTILDLDALFDPLRLCASGVHGAEFRLQPGGVVAVEGDDVLDPVLTKAVQTMAASIPGTIVEDKRFSAAIHYRQAPGAAATIEAKLRNLLDSSGDHALRILPGHMVFELKRATFDKGTAIRRFMAHTPFKGRKPVFIGDDVTDRPGFDAVLGFDGLAYSVGRLFEGVSGSFPDPVAVRQWLANLTESETSLA